MRKQSQDKRAECDREKMRVCACVRALVVRHTELASTERAIQSTHACTYACTCTCTHAHAYAMHADAFVTSVCGEPEPPAGGLLRLVLGHGLALGQHAHRIRLRRRVEPARHMHACPVCECVCVCGVCKFVGGRWVGGGKNSVKKELAGAEKNKETTNKPQRVDARAGNGKMEGESREEQRRAEERQGDTIR
jgi:hypothetical protein